jgi:hypothetical protein
MSVSVGYHTKDQMLKIMAAWNTSESLPKKSQKVVIAFPPGANFRTGIITVHDKKSTYGTTLYKLLLTNDLLCPPSNLS